MSAAEKILEEALDLPASLRAKVAAALLASLERTDHQALDNDAEWTSEIERRAERVRAGQSQGEPWHFVRQRLASRLDRD